MLQEFLYAQDKSSLSLSQKEKKKKTTKNLPP